MITLHYIDEDEEKHHSMKIKKGNKLAHLPTRRGSATSVFIKKG